MPRNLGQTDEPYRRVTILDFGLARDEDGPEYYRTFKPVGAMTTCAPEKWLDPSLAGPAADVFSVGVIFYRLLTGRFPFWSDTYIGLYEKIKSGEYEPASRKGETVPGFLDIAIGEMLEPRLEWRIQSARDALQLLDEVKPLLDRWSRRKLRRRLGE